MRPVENKRELSILSPEFRTVTMGNDKFFRNYDNVLPAVRENYRKMRANQTLAYAQRMREKYLVFDNPMPVWNAIGLLDEFVDLSDPDIDLPNVQHLVQTAEGIREAGKPDWMQLVGLIHDLGKILYHRGCDADGTSLNEQWGMVGDIFLVGCALPESAVFPEFNALNPDMQDARYNTPLGIYTPNCGLDACITAWGHDEYLYQVLRNHPGNRIPEAGMVMIRYHSFYPWHSGGAYRELMSARDHEYLDWVRDFSRFDLYTKSARVYDLAEMRERYQPLIEKYLGTDPIRF